MKIKIYEWLLGIGFGVAIFEIINMFSYIGLAIILFFMYICGKNIETINLRG